MLRTIARSKPHIYCCHPIPKPLVNVGKHNSTLHISVDGYWTWISQLSLDYQPKAGSVDDQRPQQKSGVRTPPEPDIGGHNASKAPDPGRPGCSPTSRFRVSQLKSGPEISLKNLWDLMQLY